MTFARPRSIYRAARARNFIVGVVAVAFIFFSQAWRSIAHREGTWTSNNEAVTHDHTISSIKASTGGINVSPVNITEVQEVGLESEKALAKNAGLTSVAAAGEPLHCAPILTASVAKSAAAGSLNDNRIMLTMVSNNQLDLFHSWLASVRGAGIKHILVGAMDNESALQLVKERVSCFRHQPPENIESLGLAWGQEGWRIMTWQQVFVIKDLVDWGLDVIVTDIDVTWIRDPWPLFDRHLEADCLFSHDGVSSRNQHPKEEDLEVEGNPHYNLNTGIYIIRSNNATRTFMSEWVSNFKDSNQHDQSAMYLLLRNATAEPSSRKINDPGLTPAFNNQLLIGVVPVYSFGNGHSYTVSRLHTLWNTGQPYAVHATWTYSGKSGKISRLREAMLWHDEKEYYSNGNFVTGDLQVPEMPKKLMTF